MDRMFLYPGELITDVLFEQSEKNAMLGMGHLSRAVLGTGPEVAGLVCSPTSPASMSVTVGTGSIYALANVDSTAYGSLAADTVDQIVKQGINAAALTFACPAPSTAGQSIVYLIEAAYVDQDSGNQVLTYFNSTNPSMPFTGPGNAGTSQPTVRQGLCSVQSVAGVPATTGSAVPPAVSSGYSGLYTVTVAYGATTIVAGNIAVISGAPFIPYTLPALGALTMGALQKANNLSDLGSVATTLANLGFAQLASANGYLKLPGGIIIQWGTVTNNSGSTTVPVSFPEAFPTNCWGVINQASLGSVSGASGTLYYVGQVFSVTTTGFYSDVMLNGDSNPVGQQAAVNSFYIAIGN